MAEPITIVGLTKTYPGSIVPALRSVSLDVAPGAFLVLLGPSGSGKTTLLRCLAGIERIDSGLITIGGRAVADGRAHVAPDQRDLSMVFQDYALWPHMTALDNVAFALRRRRLPRAECRARAAAMLDRVGLGEFARRYPNELSGGQQQRVALARALIADTGLILCDEPLSDVVGVLEEGVLVQSGTPEDVYNHPATPFVARFTGLAGEIRVRVAAYGSDGTLEITAPAGTAETLPALRPASLGAAATRGRRCGPATRRCSRSARPGCGSPQSPRARRTSLGRLAGVFARHRATRGDEVGLRLEPDGCHLFPADDSGTSAVREYASA